MAGVRNNTPEIGHVTEVVNRQYFNMAAAADNATH